MGGQGVALPGSSRGALGYVAQSTAWLVADRLELWYEDDDTSGWFPVTIERLAASIFLRYDHADGGHHEHLSPTTPCGALGRRSVAAIRAAVQRVFLLFLLFSGAAETAAPDSFHFKEGENGPRQG